MHEYLKGPPAKNVPLNVWNALTSNKRRIG
jgi:hypothetical protein